MLPWAVVWALASRHHLGATAVAILAAVTIPLSTLWLTWAGFRNASRHSPAGAQDTPGTTPIPSPVVAGPGGTGVDLAVDQRRREVTGKPVRLLRRPVFLTGREDLLAHLEAFFTAAVGEAGPQVLALSGLGGAGKTSIALEYAHRHVGEAGLVWQFAADDPTALAAGFGELAAQLGARRMAGTQDPVASVHAVLATFPALWLLLFDNVTDLASVAAFLPPTGPGRVLITTQNAVWPGQILDVPMLDQDAAAGFLVSRSGDRDRRAAWDLAGELGGLPLALEQAAAYVKASGGTLAGYLAAFRARRADMLGRGEPAGYRKTVATTLGLAFEDVERSAPGAAGLLRLLAFCAPEAIPLRLLLQRRPGLSRQLEIQQGMPFRLLRQPRPGQIGWFGEQVAPVLVPLLDDELAIGDAIGALRRYSLVTPGPDGSVSVHRLVQAVTRDQMPDWLTRQWRQAAVALIETAIPGNTERPGSWPVCAALLPHAQAALNLTSDGQRRIAQYLGSSGNYPAARDLFQLIVDAHTQDDTHGPGHPDTLAARHQLARWTGEAGDPAAARDQHAALLSEEERVLGPEDPRILHTRGGLAYWTREAGDVAAARDQYAALLAAEQRALGPEDPETLTTHGNLAVLTGQAGDAAAARDQYAALLRVEKRVLGPEHPKTLIARGNLAHWTRKAGDAAAARDQLTALLPVAERVLGPEHPTTLTTRANLADSTGDAGDPVAARDQYAALLPVAERVLGPEHPNTLTIGNNHAYWTERAERGPSGA